MSLRNHKDTLDAGAAYDLLAADVNTLQNLPTVLGISSGYKIARGVHQQAAASDTIATGLSTVVAVVVSWRDAPTLKQMFLAATIGDQSAAPVAGSFISRTYQPTASGNVTPTAATDFTDNLSFNWIAIGT